MPHAEMLACVNCARPVVFAVTGWVHRDPDAECALLKVAWPPPSSAGTDDSEADEDVA